MKKDHKSDGVYLAMFFLAAMGLVFQHLQIQQLRKEISLIATQGAAPVTASQPY